MIHVFNIGAIAFRTECGRRHAAPKLSKIRARLSLVIVKGASRLSRLAETCVSGRANPWRPDFVGHTREVIVPWQRRGDGLEQGFYAGPVVAVDVLSPAICPYEQSVLESAHVRALRKSAETASARMVLVRRMSVSRVDAATRST